MMRSRLPCIRIARGSIKTTELKTIWERAERSYPGPAAGCSGGGDTVRLQLKMTESNVD